MVESGSAAALEFQFACLEEWLAGKPPRTRIRFLHGLVDRLEAQVSGPIPVTAKGRELRAGRAAALAALKERLPRLMDPPDGI